LYIDVWRSGARMQAAAQGQQAVLTSIFFS
jgi:hypothetical protein